MPRACAVCGKTMSFGNMIERRGLAKKQGGVGKKITGINRRKFLPNLQRVRVVIDGVRRRARVCTRCIKNGRVRKAG